MQCIQEINELAQVSSTEQVFRNEPTSSVSKDTIIKMRVLNKQITSEETEICKILGKYKIATTEQLYAMSNRSESVEDCKKKLDKMVALHLINKFILISDGSKSKRFYELQGLEFYCFDIGTKYLLENYEPTIDVSNWKLSDIMGSAEFIYQKVRVIQMAIKLKESNISYKFTPQPLFKTKRFTRASFSITTKTIEGLSYFVGYTAPLGYLDAQNVQNFILFYQEFVNSNFWKGYFLPGQQPVSSIPKVIFILNKNEEIAQVVKLIYSSLSDADLERFNPKNYIFTTYSRLESVGVISDKSFIIYNEVNKSFDSGGIREFQNIKIS